MEKKDVVIIGAGIAGMTAALYLKRFNIDVVIIEKEIPGGQLNKMPRLKNYPGFLENDGSVLAQRIYKQLEELNVEYAHDSILEIITEPKKIVRTKNHEYECNQIIIATGRSPRELNAPGESKLLGHGISYCAVCDGFFFKEKEVAVIGGSRTAIENALYLAKMVKKCYIICRKPYLRGEDINIKELENASNVEIIYNSTVKEFVGENNLEKIILDNRELAVSGAFISIGYEPNSDLKIDLDLNNGYIKVNRNYETNLEGIFAIGDVIDKTLYQLTTAASEAAIVANYIKMNFYK